jgi:YidC/Oxa1 family membrane protein insertase
VKWAGTDLKYFTRLVVLPEGVASRVVFETLEPAKAGATVLTLEPTPIDPGLSVTRSYYVFLGPKEPELLATLGFELERSIDRGYSWVSPLAALFERALNFINAFVGNYGVTIIVLTILVRLATWPIMARQMQSAEKMREIMPRVKELQEKYKDDRQKQSEETFKLYRETGVNPLAGCFPLLLQMPVFIGLFYALQSSIELRHAPFLLWINDLSQPATAFMMPGLDFPVRFLPLLMGASMFAQQKMTPQSGMDPAQQKMMLLMMPGMMLFISYGFPSGLVLYWTVSNLLGIAHQFWVRRKMQTKEAAA